MANTLSPFFSYTYKFGFVVKWYCSKNKNCFIVVLLRCENV